MERKDEVVSKINNGIDVIVDIDWQGTRQLKNSTKRYCKSFHITTINERTRK